MFGLFRKTKSDPMLEYIRKQDLKLALEEAEYHAARPVSGAIPSIEGNKVIFDAPELESIIESKCGGIFFVMHTGSIALEGNKKVFKNDKGEVHRIEIFQPMCCVISYE